MSDSPEHSVRTTLYECNDCGERAVPTHHDCHPSSPPVLYINDGWLCSRCGITITPKSSCFNCGNRADISQVEVGLNLRPHATPQEIEQKIHAETNSSRRSDGYSAIKWDQHLSMIALTHSRDMAVRDFFSHATPDRESTGDRAQKYNYQYQKLSENISYRTVDPVMTADEIAEEVVQGWMESDGHRKISSIPHITHHGAAYYMINNLIYVTQNFARPTRD